MDDALRQAKDKMNGAIEHLQAELKKIRTGRANPQILDGVEVEVYGQMTPLQHIANINAVDSQMLMITPFDPNSLNAISAAIRKDSSLGLNPADDGKVIRVPLPPLTEERRQQIAKQVGEKAEEARISLRNARHEVLSTLKQQEKDSEITQDDLRRGEKEVSDMLDTHQTRIQELAEEKEQEIMTV